MTHANEQAPADATPRHIVVQYKLRPERVDEHERLLGAVFEELAATRPEGLRYEVLRLADGVSYVHHATLAVAANPLLALASFKRFSAEIASRCEVPPASSGAREIGRFGDVR